MNQAVTFENTGGLGPLRIFSPPDKLSLTPASYMAIQAIGTHRDLLAGVRLGYYVIDSVPTEEERLSYPRIATFTSRISYAAYRTEFDRQHTKSSTVLRTLPVGRRSTSAHGGLRRSP